MNIDEFKKEILSTPIATKEHLSKILNAKQQNGNDHISVYFLKESLKRYNKYQPWFDAKIKEIKKTDKTGASAILGEMRTILFLDQLFPANGLQPKNGNGCDFDAKYKNYEFAIELNTQLGSQKTNTKLEHPASTRNFSDGRSIMSKITEYAPYGFPEKHTDTVQGDGTSKIAGIKCKEHQFTEWKINILWIDYLDPDSWIFSLVNQVEPIQKFNNSYMTGAIWWAMYGKKGDKLYDNLEVEFGMDTFYMMEFNGKFQNKSKINFVITAFPEKFVIFQNPKRRVPDDIIIFLMGDNKYDYKDSWVNFPLNDLRCRIIYKRWQSKRLISKLNKNKNNI